MSFLITAHTPKARVSHLSLWGNHAYVRHYFIVYFPRSNIAFKSCQASKTDKISKPKIKTTADKRLRRKSFLAVAQFSWIKSQRSIFDRWPGVWIRLKPDNMVGLCLLFVNQNVKTFKNKTWIIFCLGIEMTESYSLETTCHVKLNIFVCFKIDFIKKKKN